MVTSYSQRDTEWSEDALGASKELTLGQAGCLVTSIASTLSDFTDRPISPGELNWWLRENRGFVGGGLFVFTSIETLGLHYVKRIDCQTQPAPIDHLTELLAAGFGVVIQVDSRPGGELDQHWVRLLAVDERDGQIMDPWQLPGGELVKLSKYFAADWTPARAIFTAVVYQSLAQVAGRDLFEVLAPDVPVVEEHQDALCLRPEA